MSIPRTLLEGDFLANDFNWYKVYRVDRGRVFLEHWCDKIGKDINLPSKEKNSDQIHTWEYENIDILLQSSGIDEHYRPILYNEIYQ